VINLLCKLTITKIHAHAMNHAMTMLLNTVNLLNKTEYSRSCLKQTAEAEPKLETLRTVSYFFDMLSGL